MKDVLKGLWLGSERGYLSDWVTQKWVILTGRSLLLNENSWLDGPIAGTDGIGGSYFEKLAVLEGLRLESDNQCVGLIDDLSVLTMGHSANRSISAGVRAFYEKTSDYTLDVWSEWSIPFRPFGRLLALVFSQRLQQLNVPLSSLDTSQGMTSAVLKLVDPASGKVRYTAWLRHLVGTGNVLYAGTYSTTEVPGFEGVCIKVVFPLPNGNAIVIMKPETKEDGSLLLSSKGRRFGDPGFYFVVHDRKGGARARYVRAMHESIHVFEATDSVRADHVLELFGSRFLKLHYRMARQSSPEN